MIANLITGIRIVTSLTILFYPVFSTVFYVLYLISGLSDIVDGIIARKTNTVSEFGSKYDSFADFVLVLVCLIKMIPVMHIPNWLLIWIIVIAIIKIINLISGYVMQKKIVVLHTFMNKIAGMLLFLLPLTLTFVDLKYTGTVVCTVATFAAVQEGHFIRTSKNNN